MKELLGEYRETAAGQIATSCPFCGREKMKFVINPKTGAYICFHCDARGRDIFKVFPLFKYIIEDNDFDLDFAIFDREKQKITVNIDKISEPMEDFHLEFMYLEKKRGLTMWDVNYFNIRTGIGKMQGSIIIPVYDEVGDCVYYIRRLISTKAKIRYLDPVGMSKLGLLSNWHIAKDYDRVVLTEGWFTGRAFGVNFLCSLGKFINQMQAHQLAKFEHLYYCPDSDVTEEEVLKNLNMLLSARETVHYLQVPRSRGKIDADDMSQEDLAHMANNAFEVDHFTVSDFKSMYNKNIW